LKLQTKNAPRRQSIMKINDKQRLLAHIARRSLVLGSLLVLALTCASARNAQSSGPNAPTQVAKPATATEAQAQMPATSAKPAAAQTKALHLPEEKNSAKGAKEGISVHGHWTIEVRNPDGSVDKHVEFENGICPTQTGLNDNIIPNTVYPGAALFFSQLATGQSTLGAWMIFLGNHTSLNTTPNVPPGCMQAGGNPLGFPGSGYSLIQNVGIFSSFDPSSPPSPVCLQVCATMGAPTTPTSASPSISFGGTVPGSYTLANGGGEIDMVSTVNLSCPGCTTATLPVSSAILTGTQLIPGSSTPPVTYIAGQSISVAVIISFSGN
jgi:hypothetical protein